MLNKTLVMKWRRKWLLQYSKTAHKKTSVFLQVNFSLFLSLPAKIFTLKLHYTTVGVSSLVHTFWIFTFLIVISIKSCIQKCCFKQRYTTLVTRDLSRKMEHQKLKYFLFRSRLIGTHSTTEIFRKKLLCLLARDLTEVYYIMVNPETNGPFNFNQSSGI